VRMVSLDISKAFDTVWHKWLLFKLERLGVRDPLLKWIKSYINWEKTVCFNRRSVTWLEINWFGCPSGSVLGPLLFFIYINDITHDLQSNIFLYADDTSRLEIVDDPCLTADRLNHELECIKTWKKYWLVTINPDKTKSMIFSVKLLRPNHPPKFLIINT
jgi:hypothetical protein